ncbi:hypothetical protein H2198_002482 [Neophaeococcomyces mojaviensis]|uniref:Uncharacterized protein n=1 Tax=Neophaeococcomyces mojaviensis TaxID=3383035 RepID=A0ACC3AE65_9EURO|nr:hypothetical protein H2198_002482 [Knufia sp. JES_112]
MVDTASIVIAVVSMVGALSAALFTVYGTYLADERKRRHGIQVEVRKYSDPLLVAADDLQDRLYEILDVGFTKYDIKKNENGIQNVEIFSSFLLAQFLAWARILKIQTQFLAFSEDKSTSYLRESLYKISDELSTNRYPKPAWEFRLWPGHQLAIGELMLVKDKDTTQLTPMGFHDFNDQFKERFSVYFHWFIKSIHNVNGARYDGSEIIPDGRGRRLQHLLVDLVKSLDSDGNARAGREPQKCIPAAKCDCLTCGDMELAKDRRDRRRSCNAKTAAKLEV